MEIVSIWDRRAETRFSSAAGGTRLKVESRATIWRMRSFPLQRLRLVQKRECCPSFTSCPAAKQKAMGRRKKAERGGRLGRVRPQGPQVSRVFCPGLSTTESGGTKMPLHVDNPPESSVETISLDR